MPEAAHLPAPTGTTLAFDFGLARIGVAEGDGWLTLRLQLASQDLAKMLVLGLGAHAIVVEPAELQQAVLDTARAILSGAQR